MNATVIPQGIWGFLVSFRGKSSRGKQTGKSADARRTVFESFADDFYKNVPSRFTPLGDVATGEDIADAVWYFAAHSKNTTGAELTVDGGNTIQLYPIIKSENTDSK